LIELLPPLHQRLLGEDREEKTHDTENGDG
jgi:hypothetical protein